VSVARFQIVYDGPALEGSTIDVRELAPALLALGQVLEEANATFNAGHAKVALRVSASFRSGCFGIDFSVVQGLLDQALALFQRTPIAGAKELVELLGFVYGGAAGLVSAIKWLRGRAIREVIELENGKVRIVADEDFLETERKTIDLLRNYRLRAALEKAIYDPLERDGFNSVSLTDDPKKGFVLIDKSERGYFKAPPQEEEMIDDRVDTVSLQLVSVSFRDENKWRFSDGGAPFYAAVLDDDFLNRVKLSEESFTAGDILKVKLRKKQWLVGDAMKSEHEVMEVMEHRKGMAQLRIPFKSADGETL
jgi:hypothetical protein